jgi:ATP-dependent exoDNAse (exonuclease V) alpha subunit
LESQHAVNPDVGANAFEAALKATGQHSVKIVDDTFVLSPLLRAEREIHEAVRSAVARRLFAHRPIPRTSVKLNDTQTAAVSLAIRSPISFIAGGPGTGKTTICEAIAGALGSQNVLGAALANRAANNLRARARIETINIAKLLHTKALGRMG